MADLSLPPGFVYIDPTAPSAPAPVGGGGISYEMVSPKSDDIPAGFVEYQHQPIEPTSTQTLNSAVGSFATGSNRGIAAGFGAPVDLVTGALNLVPRGINAATGTRIPLIEHPIGGSESINKLITALVGETKPQTALDEALAAAGSGVGATASTMLGGGAIRAAGLLPKILEPMFPEGGSTYMSRAPLQTLDEAGNIIIPEAKIGAHAALADTGSNLGIPLAIGGGSGVGSYAGQNIAGQFSDDPLVKEIGGLLGGLAGGGGAALATQAPSAYSTLRAPFKPAGQQDIVGKILRESATNKDFANNIPNEYPFGISPTLGQASNDPGLLALERSLEQRTPVMQGEFNAQKAANNDLVGQQVGQVGTVGNPGEISQTLAGRLDAARQAAKAGVDRAYDQIPEVSVPTQPLKDAFNDYVNSLTQVRRQFVPKNYQDLLMGYADQVPMRELMDLRSSILADQRGALNTGKVNEANVLGNIERALFKGLPEGGAPLPATADQAATMAYQRASQQAAQYHQTFNTDQPIASVFQRNSTGGEKILDSAVADKLLGSGAGQADRVNQFIRASKMDPDALSAARDWFATKLQQATQGAPQAGSEQPVLNASSLRKFVQNNQSLINSRIFTDEQRTAIENIVKAREILERTANGGTKGGSDTASKLLGNNYLGALLGKMGGAVHAVGESGRSLGAGIGSVVGDLTGIGHAAGAMVGSTLGGAAASIPSSLYAGAGQKIVELLSQTMRDPALARQLMWRVTPKGDFVSSPYLRSMMGLPATVEATSTILRDRARK